MTVDTQQNEVADDPTPHSLPTSADVVVVGGGIAGLCTAYALVKESPTLRVLVAERADDICTVTTAAAGGGFRCWWPTLASLGQLARHSIRLLREELQGDDDTDTLAFLDSGYVMLSGRAEQGRVYLQQALQASQHGGGPVYWNGQRVTELPPMMDAPCDSAGQFDWKAYTTRHDGIDVIDCPSLLPGVLAQQCRLHPTHPDTRPCMDAYRAEQMAVDRVVALLHVRNAGHIDPVALGRRIAQRALATGRVSLCTGLELVALQYTDNDSATSRQVCGAMLRQLATAVEHQVATSAVVLAVGPYLPIMGARLGFPLAVANEPHGRVVYNDSAGYGPSSQRSWTYWSDPVLVSDPAADAHSHLLLPPSAQCRSWLSPTDSSTVKRQFAGVWTYDSQQLTLPKNLSSEEMTTTSLDVLLTIPPPIPVDYPLRVLQGLAQLYPGLHRYTLEAQDQQLPAAVVAAVPSGYYCKTADSHPMLDAVPHNAAGQRMQGVWICGALSGHGIMIALACGQVLARRLLLLSAALRDKLVVIPDYPYPGLFPVQLGEFVYKADSACVADQM